MLILEKGINTRQLRPVQHIQLQILLDIDKICRENRRKYYIMGGTLLGAIRHKGFIPWDDDIDIAMKRADYDWFIQNAPEYLSNKYFVQNLFTDHEYYLPYAKVRRNGTTYIEQQNVNLNIHHGVFIDIFPLDHVPDNKHQRVLQRMAVFCLSKTILAKKKVVTIESNFKYRKSIAVFLRLLALPISNQQLGKLLDRVMRKYRDRPCRSIANLVSTYGYEKNIMDQAVFGEPVDIEFEGHCIMAPSKPEDYLSRIYGDYMQIPAPEKRFGRHRAVTVQLS